MASYLVDLILLAALLFTSIRVTRMHRELVHLRTSQGDFSSVLGQLKPSTIWFSWCANSAPTEGNW